MDDSKTERGGFVKGRVPLEKALRLAETLQEHLQGIARRAAITGSVLRRKPEVGDIDLLILPHNLAGALQALEAEGWKGDSRIVRKVIDGILVEIYIAHRENELGALKLYTTGDVVFMREMRETARAMDLELTQYGLYIRGSHDLFLESPYERDFFEVLGVPWTPPEKRTIEEKKGRTALGDRHLPPKEWSPFWKKMTSPPKKQMFKGVSWELLPWRSPDRESEGMMIWYGPAGKEGDEAAALFYQNGGWGFGQYTGVAGLIDNPPAPILSTWTFVSYEDLHQAILEKALIDVPVDALERAADTWARWAAAVASTKLAYYGGTEEFVESLP